MLHFITSAPMFMVRSIMALARGWAEDVAWTDPVWAESTIHVHEDDAPAVLYALRMFRIEGRKAARAAISDPTYQMAAAALDREGGLPGAPAASRVSEDDPRVTNTYPYVSGY